MLSFASFNMLTTLTSMFAVYGSNIVVNNFFGTAINAAQGVASQISGQLMVFSNNMLMAVKPVIGKKSGSQNFASMIRIAFSSSKLSFFILFFFACPFIIEANWILNIWLKEVPEWAVTFCRLELLRRLLSQLTDSLKECIQAEGHIKSYSMQQSIFYVIHLPIVGILFYLGYSVIWLYIINIITLNFIAGYNVVYYAKKNCHMNTSQYCKDVILRSFMACLPPILCGLLIHQLLPNSFFRTIAVSLVTSIITIASVRFIGLTTNEVNIFNELTMTIKQRFFLSFSNDMQNNKITPQIKVREVWIDWAKTLLIFMMVVCHAGLYGVPQQIIYTFHMPAFFIISGYLFRPHYWKDLLIRYSIPILFFSFINLCYNIIFEYLRGNPIDIVQYLLNYIPPFYRYSPHTPSLFPGIWSSKDFCAVNYC